MALQDQHPTFQGLIHAGLPYAEWRYDEEADEMDVLLPGSEHRAGVAKLVNEEFYVRVDVDTNEPLTIIIPTFTDWLANKLAIQVRHSRICLSEDGALQIETMISAAGLFTTDGAVEPEATSVPWVLRLDLRRAMHRPRPKRYTPSPNVGEGAGG